MRRRTPNQFIRIGIAIAIISLLSAFSYPLMSEGFQRVGSDTFAQEQAQLIEQSIRSYVALRPEVNWTSDTPSRQIFDDLAAGLDCDRSGRPQSFLPSSETAEGLSHKYRILFKDAHNFKVIIK